MAEKTDVAVAERDHIIKRPRLTRLLDETTSRIILLVAPAGYGKTTLAREWLENRPHAWYRGTPASADVAALAVGLADAAATIVPGAGRRIRERLKVADAPAPDVADLADLFVGELEAWPSEALLAIDDLHFLSGTPAAERFIALVVERLSSRFVMTSRMRPRWATARRLLYGEIFELGMAALAMSPEEAGSVLATRRSREVPGLIALAEGWPAVLGLAALAHELDLPDASAPSTLYEFFAEELFHEMPPELHRDLAKLALAPRITPQLALALFGDRRDDVLMVARRLGVLMEGQGTFDLHPLLRDFLHAKLMELDDEDRIASARRVADHLIRKHEWDQAFNVIERTSESDLVVKLVEAAMATILVDGRLSTLERWLIFARETRTSSPILDLAEAELAFREGAHDKAQALAVEAHGQLGEGHALTSRALALAGESAFQLDRSELSLTLHRRAEKEARTVHDRRRAVWGQFIAAIQLEDASSQELLHAVKESYGRGVDGTLRLATARLLVAGTSDHLEDVAMSVRPMVHLVDRSSDAKIRTSFLYLLGNAFGATANYADALGLIERAKRDATEFRLDFTVPFSLLVEATSMVGLRDFTTAATLLDQCFDLARRTRDVFLDMSSRVARAKLLIAHGAFDDAADVTSGEWTHLPGPAVYGELVAIRGLALACAHRPQEAMIAAAEAVKLTRGVEARTLAGCTRAVIATESDSMSCTVGECLETALITQHYDSVVTAMRGAPRLAELAASDDTHRSLVTRLLTRSSDDRIARSAGIALPRAARAEEHGLSPREQDVFALIVRGQTNREIAEALFLSESTVKLHVRHILRKLGVRSRTEAALKGAKAGGLL